MCKNMFPMKTITVSDKDNFNGTYSLNSDTSVGHKKLHISGRLKWGFDVWGHNVRGGGTYGKDPYHVLKYYVFASGCSFWLKAILVDQIDLFTRVNSFK